MTSADALRDYVDGLFGPEPPLLTELRERIEERGLPTIQVPAATGRLLELTARMAGARRALEIGTLGGYSALWLLRGMPSDGTLVTIEKEPDRAALAREYFERAGVAERTDVRVEDARAAVASMGPDGSRDLVFIDADKESYVHYLEHAGRLLRPGGVVLADNALWRGRVVEEVGGVDEGGSAGGEGDEVTRAIRAFNRALADSDAFRATILPVGDGVALGVRVA